MAAVGILGVVTGSPALAGERQDRAIGLDLFLGGIVSAVARGPHQQARLEELIPRGSWIMDALAGLALDGKLPKADGAPYTAEYFRGNHPLTRGQVARLLQGAMGAAVAPPDITPATTPDRGAPVVAAQKDGRMQLLVWEFRHELTALGMSVPASLQPGNVPYFYNSVARAQLGVTNIGLHPRIEARGDVEGAWNGLQYTASLGNINPGGFLQPFHLSPIGPGPITGAHGILTYDADSLYLRGFDRLAAWKEFSGWTVELGRDWINWGPAYSGNLLFSDNSGPFDMLRIKKNFNMGPLGTWRFQQFISYDPEPGADRYVQGRRIAKSLTDHLEGSVSEALVSQGRPSAYSLFIPYFLAQYIAIGKVNGEAANNLYNYLIDFQMSYRNDHGNRYYGDVLLDDIVFPIPYHNEFVPPRKAGFLLGMSVPRPVPKVDDFILEGAYTDATATSTSTYLHANPLISFVRYGQVIGSPIGPGSMGIVARADLASRCSWRPFLQGTVEQHHRVLPNPDVEVAGWLGATKDLRNGHTLTATIRPYWAHNEDNLPNNAHIRADAQIYLSASF